MTNEHEAPYTVVVVKYGHRDTRRSDVFLNFGVYAEPDGPLGMDYYFWIIRNRTRTILVDSGFSAHGGARRNRTMLIDPVRALELLDIDPAGPLDILLTHAHYDHCGNLNRLPNATVTAARKEIAFWQEERSRHVLFRNATDGENIDYLASLAAAGRLKTFDEGYAVAPGIQILPVGGHTPGQFMVRVDTGGRHVLLTSDAAHYYEEYTRDMPFSLAVDPLAMLEGLRIIRQFERAGDLVIPGHDPLVFDRIRPAVRGPLAGLAAFLEPGSMG